MSRLLVLVLVLIASTAIAEAAELRQCPALAWSPPVSGLAASSNAELRKRLDEARQGGTILLAPGDYGNLDITGYHPAGEVVIAAADPDRPPRFGNIAIDRSSRITLAGLAFRIEPTKPFRIVDLDRALDITNSQRITVRSSLFAGYVEPPGTRYPIKDGMRGTRSLIDFGGLGRGMGMRVNNSDRITVEGSTFADLTVGTNFNGVDDVRFVGNSYTGIALDASDWGGIGGMLFEGNLLENRVPQGMKHADLMQFRFAASRNVTIRDNRLVSNGPVPHGIYFGGSYSANYRYADIEIADNVVIGPARLALAVERTDGLSITGNLVLSGRGAGRSAGSILVETSSTGVRVTGNTANFVGAVAEGWAKNRPVPRAWAWNNRQVDRGARPPTERTAPGCRGS